MHHTKTDQEYRDAAMKLIEEYLGEYAATSYKPFYKDKDKDIIKTSITELLTEAIGPKKTKEIITQVKL